MPLLPDRYPAVTHATITGSCPVGERAGSLAGQVPGRREGGRAWPGSSRRPVGPIRWLVGPIGWPVRSIPGFGHLTATLWPR